METALLALLVGALLLLRQPVFVILGAVGFYAYWFWDDGRPEYLVYDVWNAANSEVLVSIPLFMLAGALMAKGSIAARLIALMRALTRPIRGGLALATILSCGLFAAVSGSSVVTMLAVGSILYPALLADGYRRDFALGALAAGGTLGILIPPSIPLILYGVATDTSIADLFLAGIGPGLLLLALFAIYAVAVNRHRPREPMDWAAVGSAFRRGVFAIAMPVLVLGGIYSGHFTPTEAAAVAVFYALCVEVLVHRELSWREARDAVLETSTLLGGLFLVLGMALSLNVFFTYAGVPERLVGVMQDHVGDRWTFLVAANLMLLLAGCFMDIGSAILVLAPLLSPVAASFGIDPVHFGIIMIMNLEIGYLTPPLGLNLIVAMSAFKEDFRTVCRAVVPFILLMLAALAIVTVVPQLPLLLVR